ncbi:MAG: anthranilate phosphoribosyltransferase [Phycisphaerae bacterium]
MTPDNYTTRADAEQTMDTKPIFTQLTRGADLSRAQARRVFDEIISGRLPEAATGALLGALMVKGECVDELVGAGQAMRAKMHTIACEADCIDTCGTGGDGISTFNVSTTAGIIAAAAGATVAKHGNRSTTRASGSTEVLASLGIDVEASPATVERCLVEARIGYLNARSLHPAMKYAAPVRAALPVRTIFNLLGPLTNPAGAKRQIVGVPRADLAELMANALRELGAVHAWVVHGGDGLCDLTITAETSVVELRDGQLHRFTIRPEDVHLSRCKLESLLVDSPAISGEVVQAILRGLPGPQRDHALLNAGAAIVVAGIAGSLLEGVEKAASAVDSGMALDTFHLWRAIATKTGNQ